MSGSYLPPTRFGIDSIVEKADQILRASSIVTMDEDQPTAEAVGISKGRIVAVGSREEVRVVAEPGAQETDFGDTCVLPGLIEPHTHPDLCAQCYAMVDPPRTVVSPSVART